MHITVPGGESVPMAGTTMISVRPSHTRRGILRAMMASHLAAAREQGQPLAGLWASESAIYGRFGFGPATDRLAMELPAAAAELPGDGAAGSVRLVTVDEALELFPLVHEQVRATTPGVLSRSAATWKWRLYDPVAWREGMSARRLVVSEGVDGPEGFATYRVKEEWEDFTPNGKVDVNELQAATPEAHAGLWRYLTSIDLFPRVSYWNTPVDDALRWQVASPRLVQQSLKDALWVKLLDVPAALSMRRYASAGTLTVSVKDAFIPELSGTYQLSATPDTSRCIRTEGAGQIEMDAATLGMLYLGGRSVEVLARAGLVSGEGEAIALADAMFSWRRPPWCPEVF
jgi:predicted acetyltransferase